MSKLTRRTLLKKLAFGSEQAALGNDKILVCIFLRGGADTLNMFVPYADSDYYKQRPTIAIPPPSKSKAGQDASIKLNDLYALHPRLKPILPIFQDGRLAVIQSVGSDNPTGSHFDTQDQVEHGEAYGKTIGGGWLGRHLRTRSLGKSTPLSAVSIGTSVCESLSGAPSVCALGSLDEIKLQTKPEQSGAMLAALTQLYGADVGLLSQPGRETIQLLNNVQHMHNVKYTPENGASYPDDGFSRGLKEIARLVKANVGLQAACIDFGGWDTHFVQGSSEGLQAENIATLGKALAAFDADIQKYHKRVTTIVMTEFGRRTYENGSLGTDHGQGAAMMVIGGGVKGGKFYGDWTGVADQEVDLLGPSGLRIKYDYRAVLQEVLSGLQNNRNAHKVFPDLKAPLIGFAPLTSA
ncbi:MAG TPA: DUF1501 domain-containing protein [Drouetiella sp.]|jgi:uncharacterized protein (DUF1501 family)